MGQIEEKEIILRKVSNMKKNSLLMSSLRHFGLDNVAWSLRRYFVPVKKTDLVLEVGAGGNPYPRANVLLDAYTETRERHWTPLVSDRPTVIGFAENLPFKDKTFDFVIAAHVLEHSAHPEKFLSELQRVAKSGYIEVPDAIMERLNPYKDHRLEITKRDGALKIKKKKSWSPNEELVELYENKVKLPVTELLIPKKPFDFHVRYFWDDEIKFDIINHEVDAEWEAPEDNGKKIVVTAKAKMRERARTVLRFLLSQNTRNNNLNITHLLRCPSCLGTIKSHSTENKLACNGCNKSFKIDKKLIHMSN